MASVPRSEPPAGGQPIVATDVPAQVSDADREYVEHVVRRSGTSFYWAMRLLPPEKRHAMFAVYAFCREVDDIADEPGDPVAKQDALAAWRDAVERLYRGVADQPVTAALLQPVARFGLRKEDFLAVIDGMEMDAGPRIRIRDMAELQLYCDRVACAVGRLSVRIFGVPQPTGDRLAAAQGQALQLTNILRDIEEDAQRDRLYLPVELLLAGEVMNALDLQEHAAVVLKRAPVAQVCAQLAEQARRCFDEARALAQACERQQVRPAVIMMEVYRRTFRRLVGRGWDRWAEPVSVPASEKLWVALRYGVM